MAEPGLTYYDDRNKVESSLLQTYYQVEHLDRVGSQYPMKYTRIRTKNYSYVGLSRTTAKACVEAKLAQYTRTYYYWENVRGRWEMKRTYDNQYQSLVASVQASRQAGDLYNVDIQVNEECVIYSNGIILDQWLESTFNNYFPNWTYDE
jgi:hypothetical protein